ncbi:hypothetical protein [Mycolicibacterium lutetiense]|uniref:Bacteriophage protein n=1 Tax=Mycolicibacterium lutetiense TaxID=1641992 RepID=A0ABS5A0A9_9MYCO|nr:hypothetical protein [Mycolicibacterium lutetiense]MBP2455187.1 hypothetical protein [Mycolicibacterium lutetiense]
MTIGNDTITLIQHVQIGVDEFMVPIYDNVETTITGCSFQAGQPTEDTALMTTIVSATARVYMPVTAVTRTIKSTDQIKHAGLTYHVRGPIVIPTDLAGREDHVWCIAEWTAG